MRLFSVDSGLSPHVALIDVSTSDDLANRLGTRNFEILYVGDRLSIIRALGDHGEPNLMLSRVVVELMPAAGPIYGAGFLAGGPMPDGFPDDVPQWAVDCVVDALNEKNGTYN